MATRMSNTHAVLITAIMVSGCNGVLGIGSPGLRGDAGVSSDAPCASGLSQCSTTCVNETNDVDHCGSCSTVCPSSEACTNSMCIAPALTAIHPEITTRGASVLLEGIFGSTATVSFPGGGGPVSAVVLGSQRAMVTVPTTAITGDVTVTTRGQTTSAVRLRVATFGIGLGVFRASYEQAGYAQATPSLTQSRTGATSLRAGHWLYVFGGLISGTPSASIERALVNADGSLGPFQSAGIMTRARAFATALRIGDSVVVVGGTTTSGLIERAAIASDGTVGAFAPGESLVTARAGATAFVVGRWLYVVGGSQPIERAPIVAGTVGPFAAIGTALLTNRSHAMVQVTGAKVVVIGGDAGAALTSIEEAVISPEGDLGPFSTSMVTLAGSRTSAGSAVLNGRFYIFGGSDGTQDLDTIVRFDVSTSGSVTNPTSMPGLSIPRNAPAVQLVNNFLYLLGGSGSTTFERASVIGTGAIASIGTVLPSDGGVARAMFTSADFLYQLDGVRDTPNGIVRSLLAPDGTPSGFGQLAITNVTPGRTEPTLAVAGSHVYVTGGTITGNTCCSNITLTSEAILDTNGAIGNFADASKPLAQARAYASSVVVGANMYVLGGDDFNGTPSDTIEHTQLTSSGSAVGFNLDSIKLKVQRYHHGIVVLGTSVYVLGGANNNAGALATIEVSQVAGGVLGNFDYAPVTLSVARQGASVAVVGDKLYVYGGRDLSGQLSPTIEVSTIGVDNTLGPFSTVTNLAVTATGQSAVVENGILSAAETRLSPLKP
jgi:hypothetical protein